MACTADSGSCEACRGACRHKPGWFAPGEVERTAELLGLTLAELFQSKLSVDWWEADGVISHDVFVLSPAVVGGTPGSEFDSDPKGVCVFYVGGRCSIHEAKPYECRTWWCGMPTSPSIHQEAAHAWDSVEAQDQVRELLGREPIAAPSSFYC